MEILYIFTAAQGASSMVKRSGGSKFLARVQSVIRARYLSIRTEEAYVHWIRRFILHHGKRHPEKLGEADVAEFLTHLAVTARVSPSTQNQALNALVILYKHVLDSPLGDIQGAVRAKRSPKVPVVLSREEVASVLQRLSGQHWLIGCLQYGSGLRLMESPRLRVQDLDFDHRAIYVRQIYTHVLQRGGSAVVSPLGAVIGANSRTPETARAGPETRSH